MKNTPDRRPARTGAFLRRKLAGADKRPDTPFTPDQVACSDDGRKLFAAMGDEITVFEIGSASTSEPYLTRRETVRAPGQVAQLICHGHRPLAVIEGSGEGTGEASLFRLSAGRLTMIAKLPVMPRTVTEQRGGVFALLPSRTGSTAEVLRLDPRSGNVLARVEVSASTRSLRPGTGTAVLAVDTRRKQVRRIDMDEACDRTPGRPPRDPEPPNGGGTGSTCCGHHRCDCGNDGTAPPDDRRPIPPRRPPRDYCDDGMDGVEEDCFVYTVTGFSIVCRDICHPDHDPCRRRLHTPIDRIELLGKTLFAVTGGGRTLETLDARSLTVRAQNALPGPGSLVLTARSAGQLIALAPDLSQIFVAQAAGVALDLDLDLGAEISEKLVIGADSPGGATGPLFALTQTPILIVPIVNASQSYNEPDATAYRDALTDLFGTDPDNAPLAKVQRYYAEQSDQQQQLEFTVFGANTPDFYTGAPIEIENDLTSFFYGDFNPGGMLSVVLLESPTATIAMRGNETREITAISSVNAGADDNANEFPFLLEFPAAIVRLNLDDTDRIRIPMGGPDWPLNYVDQSGSPANLTLESSNLSQTYDRTFTPAGAPFSTEVDELQAALNEMLQASSVAGDFAGIDVVWGKRPGETLGRLYILFRFASGGSVPRFTDLGSDTQIGNFFGISDDAVRALLGTITMDLSLPQSDQENTSREFKDYLILVMRIAEIQGDAPNFAPNDPKLSTAIFSYGDNNGVILFASNLILDSTHGGDTAGIAPGDGTGPDPLNLAGAHATPGSSFPADSNNMMKDKAAFYEMIYTRMANAVDTHLGGAPAGGWDAFKTFLEGFATVYTFPVDPPPASASGAWTVNGPASTSSLRAFVRTRELTTDTGNLGRAASSADVKWGMNFQSFDTTMPSSGGNSPREAGTRTFAHELGHTLGLSDQYSSSKFDPTIQYIGGLDLMGSSQSDWPHFCAYHKIAVGWWQTGDHLVISRPPDGDTDTSDFILVPTEWWQSGLTSDARAAISDGAGLPVVGVALCDLGGDGGVLATIEARAPGASFSGSMAPDSGEAGRVIIFNVLDYGESGRYGQVITDDETQPPAVVDGLLRYRRKIHKLAGNLQPSLPGDDFAFDTAPGFPFDGLSVRVQEEGAISIVGTSVPVYRCRVEWTGSPGFDVGFADNEVEWRSSDIAIDYIGEDPNSNPGPDMWPDGEPQGVGEKVVIPPEGGEEPHRVLLRVSNFGNQTVRDVRVELYLREPGGGGELHGGEPFAMRTIDELEPVADVGPTVVEEIPWTVRYGQEPHICWRAEVRDFRIGSGANSQVVTTDASPTNNWAQQNIFEADVTYSSPPEPLESRFSVANDGPFTEIAHLVPEGLPRGVTLRIRPRLLTVPPYSRRSFGLRFEFDEEMTRDACRREMEVLMRCMRIEEHYEEPWGASLFKMRLKRKTACTVGGSWFGTSLTLSGQLEPAISVGRVSLRLDFQDGEQPRWINALLVPGGGFEADFDTVGISHDNEVFVMARYQGTDVFAPSTSPTVQVNRILPEG